MRKEPQIAAKQKVPQASGVFGHHPSPSSQLTSCRACLIKYSLFFEKLVSDGECAILASSSKLQAESSRVCCKL